MSISHLWSTEGLLWTRKGAGCWVDTEHNKQSPISSGKDRHINKSSQCAVINRCHKIKSTGNRRES